MEGNDLHGYFTSIKSFSWKYEGYRYELEIYVVTRYFKGEAIRFLLGFDDNFPYSLPIICLLKPTDHLGNIPHLLDNREICYLDLEGVICDEGHPGELIENCVELAFQTITKSMTGVLDQDYLREFDFHWHKIQKARPAESLVGDLKGPQLIYAAYWKNRRIIGQTTDQIGKYANRVGLTMTHATLQRMLYIPLTTANGILFKQAWSLSDLRRIIFTNIGFKNRIEAFLVDHHNLPVYVTLPGPESNRLHLVAAFKGSKRPVHPLLDKEGAQQSFYALSINRMDKDYLFPRAGVRADLSTKKVAVIGCGAIGSLVVQELAKTGIMNLLLIDPDIFSHNNLYRHLLGMPYIGWSKVEALKDKLEKDLPHLNIAALPYYFEEVKRRQLVNFTEYDLVIDATAVVSVGKMMAPFFCDNYPGLPVIHTWLEALGIGGHAMVTNQGDRGCYQCLYSSRDPEFGLYNRAAFAAKGQTFSKAMFGCTSRFTSFSSLDAHKTTALAVELAIKVLSGEEKGHPLLSWKGDSKYFLETGHALSDRFNNFTEQELYERRYDYAHENCPLCTKIPA